MSEAREGGRVQEMMYICSTNTIHRYEKSLSILAASVKSRLDFTDFCYVAFTILWTSYLCC